MHFDLILWDDANIAHILNATDITAEEIEELLGNHWGKVAQSKRTGRPIVFGWTSSGKHIAVVFELEDDPELVLIRPVTAYHVED